MRQGECKKYLRESCYHRIKCSVTKLSGCINMEVIPEQWCWALQLPLKASGRWQWDKDKSQPFDLHVEGWDRAKGSNIKEKNPFTGGSSDNWKKKNTIALRTVIVTKSKRNTYIQQLLSSNNAKEEFLCTNLFFHCFSLLSHHL